MVPRETYWRLSNETDVFHLCPKREVCMGNPDNSTSTPTAEPNDVCQSITYQTGKCDTGYTGNMCNECADGWFRSAKFTCGECPGVAENSGRVTAVLVAFVLVVMFIVRSAIKSAMKVKDQGAILIKILMNYVQGIMLTSSFNLNWPVEILNFL